MPHMTDIERCKTWISDKTLFSLARALNTEPYQLLAPQDEEKSELPGAEISNETLNFISNEVNSQKRVIKKFVEDKMDDLLVRILKKQQGS
jgi:hypothetical protein